MAPPTNRKRTASSSRLGGEAKRSTAAKRPPSSAKQAASKSSGPKKSSKTSGRAQATLGFSSTKRPKYQVGTKMLLDDSIYNGKVPDEVKDHLFVYEITDVGDDGNAVTVMFKNQVITPGGNRFRVYQEGDEQQVSSWMCSLLSFCFFLQMSHTISSTL